MMKPAECMYACMKDEKRRKVSDQSCPWKLLRGHLSSGSVVGINLTPYKYKTAKMAEEGGADGETITLRVKDQTGDEMFFKVHKDVQ